MLVQRALYAPRWRNSDTTAGQVPALFRAGTGGLDEQHVVTVLVDPRDGAPQEHPLEHVARGGDDRTLTLAPGGPRRPISGDDPGWGL